MNGIRKNVAERMDAVETNMAFLVPDGLKYFPQMMPPMNPTSMKAVTMVPERYPPSCTCLSEYRMNTCPMMASARTAMAAEREKRHTLFTESDIL